MAGPGWAESFKCLSMLYSSMAEEQVIRVEVEHQLSPRTEQLVREFMEDITNQMEEFTRAFSSQF